MLAGMDGRFAPSPTSDLHVGNLRTALLAWLFARDAGSRFLLRVEDLDQQRVAAARGVESRQIADLEALGIDWDGPVVRQSERLDLYRDAAASLDTYECFCSRKDIREATSAPHADPTRYPGTCRRLSAKERERRREVRPAAIRLRAGGATFTVHDRHAGDVTGVVDDLVLFRNDGTPAYNLAVVVDDGAQGVGEVVRGADLLSSAPSQGWLATRLGLSVPEYSHVGLVVNTQGERLAKRDGATDLATLGVSAGDMVRMLSRSAGLPEAASARELLDAVKDADWWQTPEIYAEWTFAPEN